MKNIDLVKTVISVIKHIGVSDVIVCAGARNVPLIHGLELEKLNLMSYFEERSAAFYALGKSKQSQKPVAIITTSGTAVAELLPATIEAFYQNIPLILITADRPKSYRGTGSPQAIEQKNIFQDYTESSLDWDVYQKDFSLTFSGDKPLHLNICFDEPLSDGNYDESVSAPLKISKKIDLDGISHALGVVPKIKCLNPFGVISEIKTQDQDRVVSFLKKNKVFHAAEFLSGIRNHPELSGLQINNLDGFSNLQKKYKFESILRVGGVPTHRIWRDLETKYKDMSVYSFSDREFSGLSRASYVQKISDLPHLEIQWGEDFSHEAVQSRNEYLESVKVQSLANHTSSELSLIHKLSEVIQTEPLYIGNSLPIREWDLVSAVNQSGQQQVFAHRGANGIDGQVASYLGWSESFPCSWCVVGDLTALYDLAALGLSHSFYKNRIVIINNSGGQIFNRLFGNQKYLNAQTVNFSGWAKLWNWDYVRINQISELDQLKKIESQKVIVEIVCDNSATASFWKDWDVACRNEDA